MYEIKYTKKVDISERVRFRCMRSAKCCTNVKGAVVIEPKDAFYLAKHLNIEVAKFYDKYTDMFFLEDTDFPIFTLKTVGKENKCIFLKGKRCRVQDAKPRTCRLYPFWVEPRFDGNFGYNLSTEQRHHPKGSLIRVKDWMAKYLTEEDRSFLTAEAINVVELAPLMKNTLNSNEVVGKILMLRYFMYDTDRPFYEQYCHNHKLLKKELEMLNERNEKK